MNELLTFTDAAARHIKTMLLEDKALGLRVSIKKRGCSGYAYDLSMISQKAEGDIHFKVAQHDLNVYIDPLCVNYVKGLTIDFVEEKQDGMLKQKRLIFINPNEKNRCGCGESFYV